MRWGRSPNRTACMRPNAMLRCTPEKMSGTLPMATPRSYQIPHSHAVCAYDEFHDPTQSSLLVRQQTILTRPSCPDRLKVCPRNIAAKPHAASDGLGEAVCMCHHAPDARKQRTGRREGTTVNLLIEHLRNMRASWAWRRMQTASQNPRLVHLCSFRPSACGVSVDAQIQPACIGSKGAGWANADDSSHHVAGRHALQPATAQSA